MDGGSKSPGLPREQTIKAGIGLRSRSRLKTCSIALFTIVSVSIARKGVVAR